jgi:hypothetical protein
MGATVTATTIESFFRTAKGLTALSFTSSERGAVFTVQEGEVGSALAVRATVVDGQPRLEARRFDGSPGRVGDEAVRWTSG